MPWDYLLHPNHRFYWLYLASSGVLALAVLLVQHKKLPPKRAWRAYWLHPGALLDYRYFLVVWLIKAYLLAPLLLSAQTVALQVIQLLNALHPPLWLAWEYQNIVLAYTATLFVVSDFSRYWLHRIAHRWQALWHFHAVHHSVEVLNPFSFYRVHPFENFLFGLRYALSAGLVSGVFIWAFGARLNVYTIIGANAFVVFFAFIGANLRHSHVYLRYPAWLEHIIMSPAQHQLHHTAAYSQKNYGSALSLWDTLFGTLQTTANIEQPRQFGFDKQRSRRYYSVRGLLLQPFHDLYRATRRTISIPAAPLAAPDSNKQRQNNTTILLNAESDSPSRQGIL